MLWKFLWEALVGSVAPPLMLMQVSGGLTVYGQDLWTPPKSPSHYSAVAVKSQPQRTEPLSLMMTALAGVCCALLLAQLQAPSL